MLNDHTITAIYKFNGGLSTTRLRADFEVIQKFCASFNFLSMDNQPLTFIEIIITDRQSPNTTDNV